MYGLITSMLVLADNRDALLAAVGKGASDLPGCVSYVVAADTEDPSLVWVTEVWDSVEAHAASLELDQVKEAIAQARPFLLGFGIRVETETSAIA